MGRRCAGAAARALLPALALAPARCQPAAAAAAAEAAAAAPASTWPARRLPSARSADAPEDDDETVAKLVGNYACPVKNRAGYTRSDTETLLQVCAINAAQLVAAVLAFLALAVGSKGCFRSLAPAYTPEEGSLSAQGGAEAPADWTGRLSALARGASASDESLPLDARVLLRFCRLGLRFCLFCSLLGLVLVPMYAGSGRPATGGGFDFSLLVGNVAYSRLVSDSSLLAAFMAAVQGALESEWRGGGVSLSLASPASDDSVVVWVTASPADGAAGAMQALAADTGELGLAVARRVSKVPGIAESGRDVSAAIAKESLRVASGSSSFFGSTVSNLGMGDGWQLWAVVLAAYVVALAFFALVRAEWSDFAQMRRERFSAAALGDLDVAAAQAQYSVMVERVPPTVRSEEALRRAFAELSLSVHSTALHGVAWQGSDRGAASLRKRLLRALGWACCGASRDQHSGTAFVTFGSLRDRLIAERQVLFPPSCLDGHYDYFDWEVKPAPEANDLIWENVGLPDRFVQLRGQAANLLCFVGVLFWSVPLIAIQGVTHPQSLRAYAPELENWLSQTWAYSLLTGYLPILAIMGLLLALPCILQQMAERFEGRKLKHKVAQKTLSRNIAFQLASLYLLTVSGTIFDSFQEAVLHPLCVGQILGNTIPKLSVCFFTWVVVRIGTTLPFLLLRLSALTSALGAKSSGSGGDPAPVYCDFVYECTNLTVVLVIGLMYAVIAPLVLPVCALYFGLSSVMYRWLFRHVYSQEFDCHGGWWRQMFNGSMFGLLGGSLALCGIFGLNTAATSRQFYVMWGLPLMVIAFHWVCNSRLEPRSREMPYQDAVLADAFAGSQAVVGSFCDDYYRGPFHKVDWAMCNDGKAEAENWRAVRPGQDRPL